MAQGSAAVDGVGVERNAMSYLGGGRSELTFRATGDEPTILMLLGGEPFEEEIVMWWNFIGRSHEEIVEQREAWNGDGIAFEPPAVRRGPGLRRRPPAGAADAEHPPQGPRPLRLRPRPPPVQLVR